MNKKVLKNNYYIYKNAKGGLGITSFLKDVFNGAVSIANLGIQAGAWGLGGAAALGGLGGYVLARASSPNIATHTAEQDITREAIDTEIDVTRRRIAKLERQREAARKAVAPKVYDRFV